eukprot:scaffold1428_cov159-Amphora_coffeaeformis.AAC.2
MTATAAATNEMRGTVDGKCVDHGHSRKEGRNNDATIAYKAANEGPASNAKTFQIIETFVVIAAIVEFYT